MYSVDNQLKIEDFKFPYGNLNKENRWVIGFSVYNLSYIRNFLA